MSDRVLFGLAVLIYAVATGYAVLLWRRGFRRADSWCYTALAAACVPHTAALLERGFSLQRCPVTNLFEAVMFISWTVVVLHLVVGMWSRLRFLCAFGAPLLLMMGVFGLQPGLDRPAPTMEWEVTRGLVSLHAALILLSYGTFGLGAAAAMLYLAQEHDLKFHKVRALLSRLPAMERLEKVVTGAMAVGVGLLTAGLLLTVGLVREVGLATVRGDPKVVWSLVVWVAYVALLVLRVRHGWGPRPLAWGALGTFAFVMLTFWGTNLMSPLHK